MLGQDLPKNVPGPARDMNYDMEQMIVSQVKTHIRLTGPPITFAVR